VVALVALLIGLKDPVHDRGETAVLKWIVAHPTPTTSKLQTPDSSSRIKYATLTQSDLSTQHTQWRCASAKSRVIQAPVLERPGAVSNFIMSLIKRFGGKNHLTGAQRDAVISRLRRTDISLLNPNAVSYLLFFAGRQRLTDPDACAVLTAWIARPNIADQLSAKQVQRAVWGLARMGAPSVPATVLRRALVLVPMADARFLSTLAWALSKIGTADIAFFAHVALRLSNEAVLEGSSPQDLANALWAYATVGIRSPSMLHAVTTHIVQRHRVPSFKPQELSNAMWAMATLGHCPAALSEAVILSLRTLLPRCRAPDVAQLAWAFATLGTPSLDVVYMLAQRCRELSLVMSPVEVSAVAWSFAVMGHLDRTSGLFSALSARVQTPALLAAMGGREAATVLWALATAGVRDTPFLEALTTRLLQPVVFDKLSDWDLSKVAWASVRLDHRPLALLDALVIAIRRPAFFSVATPQALTTLLWAVTALGCADSSLVDGLASNLYQSEQVAVLSSRSVAQVLWVFGTLRYSHPDLIAALQGRLLALLKAAPLPPREVSTCVWGLARLQRRDIGLMQQIAVNLLTPPFTPNPRDAALLVWGYATLRLRHAPLMRALATIDGPWGPREATTFLWACAKLDVDDDAAVSPVVAQITPDMIPVLPGHVLSLLLWALTSLDFVSKGVLYAASQSLLKDGALSALSPQSLALVLWAVTVAGVDNRALVGTATQRLSSPISLKDFPQQSTVMVLWAAARANVDHPPFLEAVSAHLLGHGGLHEADDQQLTMIAWAFARLRVRDVALIQATADHLAPLVAATIPQRLATAVWAFAKLGVRDDRLVDAITTRLGDVAFVATFNTQSLTSTLWGLSCSNVTNDDAFAALLSRAQDLSLDTDPFAARCYSQLHQANLHVRLNAPLMPRSAAFLATVPNFLTRCQWNFIARDHLRPASGEHRSVREALERLGYTTRQEELLRDAGCYTADIFLPSLRVAIEIDGPTHFVRDETHTHRPSGPAMFKWRQLRAFGYAVISVPYFEWTELLTPAEQSEYLRRRINATLS